MYKPIRYQVLVFILYYLIVLFDLATSSGAGDAKTTNTASRKVVAGETKAVESNKKDPSPVRCETYTTVGPCQPCTKFDLTHGNPACKETKLKRKVKCKPSGDLQYISCTHDKSEDFRTFWIFEGVMIGVAIIFNAAVMLRRQYLNAFLYQRLKRQFSDIGA